MCEILETEEDLEKEGLLFNISNYLFYIIYNTGFQ